MFLPSAHELVAPSLHRPPVTQQSSLQMEPGNISILENQVMWFWHGPALSTQLTFGLVNCLSLTFQANYSREFVSCEDIQAYKKI